MQNTNKGAIISGVIVMAGSLFLLSACGVSSQKSGASGTGVNLANGSTVSFSAAPHSVKAQADSVLAEPASDPDATFKGCWYKTKAGRYQAIEISVGTAGTYPFNALLYHGTTCDKNDYADQFGFGDPLTLGKADYIFWFSAFKNETNMSALWYLGNQTSKCVAYTATTPLC